MFRQLTHLSRTAAIPRQTMASRAFTVSLASRKSVVDTAKDVLEKANKKTGEFLAGTIENTEKVAPTGENLKLAAEKVNQKTGDVLADGIEKTQLAADSVKDVDLKGAASKVNQKTGDVLADGVEKAEGVAGKAKEAASEAKERASDVKDEAQAKAKVNANTAGYENLQDKGAKVESEQNRPDDAV
ncbi:hypothetical protein C7M61_002281 [Candidozyma pseudohaemuli]|uniref:Uncharacterized protein n=1 Tax=Candidozyma pseudohaemuli TaxID=418784 RepID=A0A2P7YSM8_9ASCO|nr:hypothetical protein C7M61_002281 [[Candida] pseudohaemulonii]PSK38974.1 hypothetical protein C7M61_002281 [[Candida] pseudohaemulonii]